MTLSTELHGCFYVIGLFQKASCCWYNHVVELYIFMEQLMFKVLRPKSLVRPIVDVLI